MLVYEVWDVAVKQLDDEELSIGYFQQDGATSHTDLSVLWVATHNTLKSVPTLPR
jgi:hypothetical protein